jgi:hypothetical protein
MPSSSSPSVPVRARVRVPVRAASSIRAVLVVLAVLVLSALPAAAQIPRGNKLGKRWPQPYNLTLLRQYLTEGAFFHTLTVDSGGSGDFLTVSAAITYVTAQNPTSTSQWTILLYPGITYTEPSLTLPPFTLLQGFTSPGTRSFQPQGRPILQITGTTGTGVTLANGTTLADLGITFTGALTPTYKAFSVPSTATAAAITRLLITISATAPNVALDILSVTGGTLTVEDTAIQRSGAGMSATRHLFCSSGTATLTGTWLQASTSQSTVVETAGGTVRLLHSRVFGGATLDLKNTSGTLSVDQVSYTTESGPITRSGALAPRITFGGATTPATCTPPELYLDTTASARLCACTAANIWACTNIK